MTEEEASQELLKWSADDFLKFSGKDRHQPAYRVQKMWGEFVRQIEKEKHLKDLFTAAHHDLNRKRLYGIRLRPDEKQIAITSLAALFKKTTA